MRDIAVVATAQSPAIRKEERRNEVEILMPVVHELRDRAGLTQKDIGFTVSGLLGLWLLWGVVRSGRL